MTREGYTTSKIQTGVISFFPGISQSAIPSSRLPIGNVFLFLLHVRGNIDIQDDVIMSKHQSANFNEDHEEVILWLVDANPSN